MKKNNNIQMPNHPFKTAQDVKRYVRDILLQVQQEETLKKIIDITSKIDYAVIYHLDDDDLEEMRFESDTVAQFIEAKQYVPSQSKDNNMLLKKFREEYKSYCKMNELTPVGSKEFSTRIKSLGFKFERYKAGGSYYVFLNKQDGEKILENITNFNDYENIDESLNV